MATGDIGSPTVPSGGNTITLSLDGMDSAGITGFQSGKSATVSVTSQGYTNAVLGTRARTVETRFISATGSSPATVTLALSEPIFGDEKVGGGANADPTISIDAGAFNDGTHSSNAVVAAAVTNNSGLTYASIKAIGRWAMPPQIIFGSAYAPYFGFQSADGHTAYLEVDAFQYFGIDCVKFTLTDGASPQTSTQSEWTESLEDSPAWKTGGTYLYRAELPVTGMANGVLTADFIVYPRIGNATSLRSSADGTWPTNIMASGCSYKFWNNSGASGTAITPVYAYYDPSSGAGGTASTTEATAQADPFSDLWDALDAAAAAAVTAGNPSETGGDTASGVIIKCTEGSLTWGNYDTTRVVTNNAWAIVTRAAGTTKANVKFNTTNSNGLRTNRVMVYDVCAEQDASNLTLFHSGGAPAGTDTTQGIWLKDVDIVGNYSVHGSSTEVLNSGWEWVWWTNSTKTDSRNGFSGAVPYAALARNCYGDDIDADTFSLTRCVLDCKVQGSVSVSGAHPDVWQVISTTGDINAVVRDLLVPSHYNQTLFNNANDCSNIAFVNVLTERVGNAAGGYGQWLNCTGSHILWWHITHPGQGYVWTDNGGAADTLTCASVRNCSFSAVSITNTDGGYAGIAKGTGVRDVHVRGTSNMVGFGTMGTGDPGYIDDKSRDVTDTGGGDYHASSSGALYGKLASSSQLIVPRDLYGNERTTSNNTIGALLATLITSIGPARRGRTNRLGPGASRLVR